MHFKKFCLYVFGEFGNESIWGIELGIRFLKGRIG